METTPDVPRPTRRPMVLAAVAAAIAIVFGALALTSQKSEAAVPATLKVMNPSVSVRSGDSGAYKVVSSRTNLDQGAGLRTDATGLAQIDYFDGSITRLGPATEYDLKQLERGAASKKLVGTLHVGRTWHRVAKLTGSESRWEVRTSNAVAAVRGTAFAVVCLVRDVCEISVVEGSVTVIGDDGERVTLEAGQAVTVDAQGDLSEVHPIDPDDPWLEQNATEDDVELPTFSVQGVSEENPDAGASDGGTAGNFAGFTATPGPDQPAAGGDAPRGGDQPAGPPDTTPGQGSPPGSTPPDTTPGQGSPPSSSPPSSTPGQGSPPSSTPPTTNTPPTTCAGGGYPPRPC